MSATSLLEAVARIFGKAEPAPAEPPTTLAGRVAALKKGSGLLCRSRYVERDGRGFLVRDARTHREERCRDVEEVVRLLKA